MTSCFGRAWAHEFGPEILWRQEKPPGVEPRYAPDRVADIRHIRLDLDLDFPKRTLSGSVTHDLTAIADPLERIAFDAVDLDIRQVFRDGRPAAFEVAEDKVFVRLAPPLPRGEKASIRIEYSVTDPILGLYFIRPTRHQPNKPKQVWSQGEDEDSRYWFPCHDYPNQKSTTEMIIRVPRGWFALSNGRLVERRDERGRTLYHWKHDFPHVTYLITLVAGRFAERGGTALGIPVRWYVPPGREADGDRAFGNTPRMVEFFSKKIGVRYPYAKYAQIAVSDFVFGGMENTTATTQTDLTLHDRRAHLDFSSDPLVAHELAHQWFGDLLTCRDWSHAWLNEGFATYFESLWTEEFRGPEEARYERLQYAREYLKEDRTRYRRPIVSNLYAEPIDIFDGHLYMKGACVLEMLRHQLGDTLFFRAIRHYVETNKFKCVETENLIHAIEEATGRDLHRFFDQWVFGGGHPELEIDWSWDEERSRGTLAVKQIQKAEGTAEVFHFPAEVAIFTSGGRSLHRVEVTKRGQSFTFDLPRRPKAVRFDSPGCILKSMKFRRPRAMLEHLLENDPEVAGRIEAAEGLAEEGTPRAVEALRRAMLRDRFWAVQAEAARALGRIRSETALKALLDGVRVKHPKARRAVMEALGGFRDERAAAALISVLRKGDPSYFVEAEAAAALGRTKSKRALAELRRAMKKDSWNDVIRCSACDGLAALERAEALDTLAEWTSPDKPPLVRGAAFRAIGRLGRRVPEIATRAFDLLAPHILEEGFRTRMNVISGLRALRDERAVALLEPLREARGDPRLRRAAHEAIVSIRKGLDRSQDVKKLREDLEQVAAENRKLRDRIEKLEHAASRRNGRRR